MSLVEELRKAYGLRGDTYSTAEVLGMLNRAANALEESQREIERIIRLDNRVLKERKDRIEELEKALEPFSEIAGEMFARNWNNDHIAVALDNPGDPHRVTAADFFNARRVVAINQSLSSPSGDKT